MDYSVKLTIYILSAITVFGLLVFWIVYSPIKHYLWSTKSKDMFYKKVYNVARNLDLYLVNGLDIKVGDEIHAHIDHLIGGDKYLYLITTYYYDGCLEARGDDRSWIYYAKNGTKSNVSNLIFANQKTVNAFSIRTGFPSNMIKGIVVVNDDCFVNRNDSQVGENALSTISSLENIVAQYEQSDVGSFNAEQLKQVIRDLHDSNEVNNG